MLYTILDVDDRRIKRELSVLCDNQQFIAKAKMVFVFLADCRRWLDCYEYSGSTYRAPGVGDLILACSDALIAAQNSVIAAESMRIGSCFIGDILEYRERVQAVLNLDKFVFPIAMVVFGYPTLHQKNRKKPVRFDRKHIVQKNRYEPMGEGALRRMHQEQAGRPDFDSNREIGAFCKRKYKSDFSLEMTRSVGEYLRNYDT